MVGNPAVTALLQEGQKRAAPVTSVPQAGQLMAGARVYHCLQQAWTPQTRACLGPIILSPLNGPVKMSPYETGDISLESERVATSGRDFLVCQGRVDVCQSGGAARSYASADQASQNQV